jgi:hypothetical protein
VTNPMNLWTVASSCGVSITELEESSCHRARRWPKSFARKIERMHSNHQAAELSPPSCWALAPKLLNSRPKAAVSLT